MNAAERNSGAEPRKESDRSLTDRAYVALEEMICTLQLEPGEVLSEGALSETLGIGRTPVREALQRLAREGLVPVLPRRGVLVSEFNVKRQLPDAGGAPRAGAADGAVGRVACDG